MPSTIKGIYNNGQVILEEKPEIDGPAEVWVTFFGDVITHESKHSLDLRNRLTELALLKDGWLNGEGLAPKKEGLEWLAAAFESNYNKALPLPCLYPTTNGGIQAEWVGNNYDISLDIDIDEKTGLYQHLDPLNDATAEIAFDLAKEEDWQLLNAKLLPLLKH